ncbi:MAG: PLP-dependent aminotransferase family protein [Chitinophagales bacterium]
MNRVAFAAEELLSQRARGLKGSDIRDAFKLTERSGMISLAGGFPEEGRFPLAELSGLIERLMATEGGRIFQYGPTEGLGSLRERVAADMAALGLGCGVENILLTSGSQQALDLVGRCFLDPGDVVLAEAPGYVGGLSAFAAYQARLVPVRVDHDGLDPDDLAETLRRLSGEGARVKLLYVVPSFQNPTGTCLPAERRAAVLRLAQEYGFLVVEDDPYRAIYFDAAPPAPLAAGEGADHVLYLGSYSKVFLPGLRLGWVAGPAPLVQRLALAKQPADLCSNIFGQKLVEAYLAEGRLPGRVAGLRAEYRAKRDALEAALRREAPADVTWNQPRGGFFLWLSLPEGGDGRRLLQEALVEGVAFVAGEAFHVDGGGQRQLRLAYSQVSLDLIPTAAQRLTRALRRHLGR